MNSAENTRNGENPNKEIVMHVTADPADVERGFAAARRIVASLAEGHVIIVVNGSAITGLTSVSQEELADVVGAGAGAGAGARVGVGADAAASTETASASGIISVRACAIAMRGHAMTASDIPTGVEIVPSGVVEIARLEMLGAGYIRL